MSPLALLLRQRQVAGVSFHEMSKTAIRKGHDLSVSRISQIANDEPKGRLMPAMIYALADALGERPERIAALDDERWGIRHDDQELPLGDVAEATRNNPRLTEQQKQTLIMLFETFIADTEQAARPRKERGA